MQEKPDSHHKASTPPTPLPAASYSKIPSIFLVNVMGISPSKTSVIRRLQNNRYAYRTGIRQCQIAVVCVLVIICLYSLFMQEKDSVYQRFLSSNSNHIRVIDEKLASFTAFMIECLPLRIRKKYLF